MIGYFMIAPGFIIYFIFVFIPVIVAFYYSFTDYDFSGHMSFIGIQNYIQLMHDDLFKKSVANTFIYALFTIVLQMVLGLLLAIAFNSNLKGKIIYRASIYLPNVTSMVAISMVWLWIYDPTLGILNRLLSALNLNMVQWLQDPQTAMGSIIVMSVWRALGFNMIVYLAGLQGIPSSLYEASKIDGATHFKQLMKITIPMLSPTTFFLLVTNTINSFMVFEQVQILTDGGPLNSTTTIVHQIYQTAFQKYKIGYSMSMAMVLFLIIVIITLANFKYGNEGKDLEID